MTDILEECDFARTSEKGERRGKIETKDGVYNNDEIIITTSLSLPTSLHLLEEIFEVKYDKQFENSRDEEEEEEEEVRWRFDYGDGKFVFLLFILTHE